jgi:hypothetical protein
MLKLRDPINSIREKIEDKIKIKGKINQNWNNWKIKD